MPAYAARNSKQHVGSNMSTLPLTDRKNARLDVFFEGGAWHWGISVPRESGCGFQVIAYNTTPFHDEREAVENGTVALTKLPESTPAVVDCAPAGRDSPATGKKEYMRERLRCAMARLVRCEGEQAVRAERWVIAWGALIGEQHFDGPLNRRGRAAGIA
jgi:hypothetical protein